MRENRKERKQKIKTREEEVRRKRESKTGKVEDEKETRRNRI